MGTNAILEFDPHRVRPLPDQPRKRFRGLDELAASIAEIGQLDPGIVTLVEGDKEFDARLVDGERRLRACRLAGVQFRATVQNARSDDDVFAMSFAANFGRQPHDAVEIAEALHRLREGGYSVEKICRITGMSSCWAYQHLNLMKLHPEVLEMMVPEDDDEAPRLTFLLAQLLMPISQADQLKLARKIVKDGGMSVVTARRMVLSFRQKKGEKNIYSRNKGAAVNAQSVRKLIRWTQDRVGIYLDMPGTHFNEMIDTLTDAIKRDLIEQIEKAGDDLVDLAEAVEARLPKRKPSRVATPAGV